MSKPHIFLQACLLAAAVGLAVTGAHAAEAEEAADDAEAEGQAQAETFHLGPVETVGGMSIEVPAGHKPAVLLFFMPGQDQSRKALQQMQSVLEGKSAFQRVVIVSGEDVAQPARTLAEEASGSVVVDPDYGLSDTMSVMAWPTTQVLSPDGRKVGHLAGLPKSYAKDLASYLRYAAGDIDRQALQDRLSRSQAVTDSPTRMAHRHLEVANRQLAKGLIPEAAQEVERGLKLAPADAELRLAKARLLLLQGKPEQALAMLGSIDRASVPPWQIDSLRGRILVALGRWEDAGKVLRRAVGLNPNPAEAYYALGLLHAHREDWKEAAEAFRKAVEHTPTGRTITPGAAGKAGPPPGAASGS
ncbi:MAG: tetratricopeptide repeat protein [Phycisphaerae bacterium]